MLNRTQKVRLGVFLLAGALLVGGAVAVLAGMSIFKRHDQYTIRFRETVSGLTPGSSVKLRGVDVGRVQSIQIDPKDSEVVVVTVQVKKGTPFPKGASAQLVTSGITGLKYIEVTGGKKGAERMESGQEIPSRPSALYTITGKAESIAFKAEQLLNNVLRITSSENREMAVGLVQDARTLLRRLSEAAQSTTRTMEEIRPELSFALKQLGRSTRTVRRTVAGIDRMVEVFQREAKGAFAELRSTIRQVRRAAGSKGELAMTLRRVEKTVAAAGERISSPDITKSINSVQTSLTALRLLLVDLRAIVNEASVDIRPVLRSTRSAVEHLEEFARTVRENPAVLLRPSTRKQRKLPRR